MDNRNNIPLPDSVVAAVLKKFDEIRDLLAPYLVILAVQEQQELAKMGDGNLPTVLKAAELVKNNPALVGDMVETDNLVLDAHTVQALLPVVQDLDALLLDVKSTRALAGSEGYVQALLAYAAFKLAARANKPGAQGAVDSLKPRFAGQGRRPKKTE